MFAEASFGDSLGLLIVVGIMLLGIRKWVQIFKTNPTMRNGAKKGLLHILSVIFKI